MLLFNHHYQCDDRGKNIETLHSLDLPLFSNVIAYSIPLNYSRMYSNGVHLLECARRLLHHTGEEKGFDKQYSWYNYSNCFF